VSAPARRLLLAASLAAILPLPALAAPILLENGVAFLEIDPASPDGLTGWTVNGVAHVRTQSFWLRGFALGAGELPLSSFPAPIVTPSDEDGDGHVETIALRYTGPAGLFFEVDLRYSLSGSAIGAPGDVRSDLTLDITLRPLLTGATFNLFQYTDVDLFTSFADDVVAFSGSPLVATVTDSSGLGAYESSWSLAPTAIEAALYDSLLAELGDSALTMLDGTHGAAGDVTHAVHWETLVPQGGSITFSQTQSIRVVPEPGTALLLACGAALLAARRGNAR
jgi:hypothetical protein